MARQLVDATCGYCGATFPRLSTKMGAAQQFCSKEHQRLGQTYVVGKAFSKAPYQGRHVCPVCETEFGPHHPSVVYCSDACRNKRRNATAAQRWSETVVGHGYVAKKKRDLKKGMLLSITECQICSRDLRELELRDIHLDHDHKTGKIRGLLCFNCNAGLGHFKDDISRLKNAIDYLENAMSAEKAQTPEDRQHDDKQTATDQRPVEKR